MNGALIRNDIDVEKRGWIEWMMRDPEQTEALSLCLGSYVVRCVKHSAEHACEKKPQIFKTPSTLPKTKDKPISWEIPKMRPPCVLGLSLGSCFPENDLTSGLVYLP